MDADGMRTETAEGTADRADSADWVRVWGEEGRTAEKGPRQCWARRNAVSLGRRQAPAVRDQTTRARVGMRRKVDDERETAMACGEGLASWAGGGSCPTDYGTGSRA